jgi:hypothetical protein
MRSADVVYLACPLGPRKAYSLAAAAAGKGVLHGKAPRVDSASSRDLVEQLDRRACRGGRTSPRPPRAASRNCAARSPRRHRGPAGSTSSSTTRPARAWQIEADWLRFRDEGGYTREVISDFLFLASRFLGPLALRMRRRVIRPIRRCANSTSSPGSRPATVAPSTSSARPAGRSPTDRKSRSRARGRATSSGEFYQLWRSDGGPWQEVIDWTTGEDPRRSALQRQLTELDKYLRGQPHLSATAREALDVQGLIEAMLAGKA